MEGEPILKSVLLVEDNVDAREIMAMFLQLNDITVIEAGDGAEALELLEKTAPDLILTDLRMPNMDGLQLAQRVKANIAHRHLPIVLISATLPPLRDEHPNIAFFVQKPFQIDALTPRILALFAK
jgi:CheY-like chemotaxis protein